MYASDLKHPAPTLEEKLRRLYTLNREKTIDLGFRPPFLKLLQQFGKPHKHLPPVIHIAGTNGKGSTLAFLSAILEAAGYKVHAYTSPHLCAFNERIVLAGREIDDAALEALIDEALELNDDGNVTFFEITTALAFAAFAREPADILLLETGLGGRLDCTNVIEKPLVSIITNIGYDHMEHLGETLEQIAAEKAGIIKKHAPCVIGHESSKGAECAVAKIFEVIGKSNESKRFTRGAEWFIAPAEGSIEFTFDNQRVILPIPALLGPHQIHNVGTAIAALKVIEKDFPVTQRDLETGLKNARGPARLQHIKTGGLAAILPQDWELWLDGGHNPHAAAALVQQIKAWSGGDSRFESKPVHLILGMMSHKTPADFADILLPYVESVRTVAVPDEPKAHSAEAIATAIRERAQPAASVEDAIRGIAKDSGKPARILIAGSLYLAGRVLKQSHINAHNES